MSLGGFPTDYLPEPFDNDEILPLRLRVMFLRSTMRSWSCFSSLSRIIGNVGLRFVHRRYPSICHSSHHSQFVRNCTPHSEASGTMAIKPAVQGRVQGRVQGQLNKRTSRILFDGHGLGYLQGSDSFLNSSPYIALVNHSVTSYYPFFLFSCSQFT